MDKNEPTTIFVAVDDYVIDIDQFSFTKAL